MALIKCPECKKEISDQAITCPNCGYPISVRKEAAPKAMPNSQQPKKEKRVRNKTTIILSILGCILLIGIANSIFSDSSETTSNEVQMEENTQNKEIPVITNTTEPETGQEENPQPIKNETNDEESYDGVVDAFKQGFDDHFNISEENQENIDSIQESVSEIVNDEEVQDAYENWKESLNELFGGK